MVNTVLLQENSYQRNGFSCLSNKDIVQASNNFFQNFLNV